MSVNGRLNHYSGPDARVDLALLAALLPWLPAGAEPARVARTDAKSEWVYVNAEGKLA